MEDQEKQHYDLDEDFLVEPVDVSEPRETLTEQEIIAETIKFNRREWIRTHKTLIFLIIGVVVVGLIVYFIQMYYQTNNPVRQFSSSLYKDFSEPFHYVINVTRNGENVMSYDGDIEVNRGNHTFRALYEADYNDYTYTGAGFCGGSTAVAGNLYQGTWSTHDCSEMALNFFDFDADFRFGFFDCGAFMRFTGLASDYSITESTKLVSEVKRRLSTDSSLATITTKKTDDGILYHYDVKLYEIFDMVKREGASIFYRSSDYEDFCEMVELNRRELELSKCSFEYFVDNDGYMTSFQCSVTAQDTTFGLSCTMSDFGSVEVLLPQEFVDAFQTPTPTE